MDVGASQSGSAFLLGLGRAGEGKLSIVERRDLREETKMED